MASRLSRAWGVRVAVTVAALAFPLFAVGSAQASIAGGNPSTTSQHPDVVSATAVDSQDVQVCFDKTLSPASPVTQAGNQFLMHLVGYNSFNNYLIPASATLVTANNKCVNLAFNTHNGSLSLGEFSAVAISGGATPAVIAGSQGNLPDSVTLSTSTTHTGTQGADAAPDLVGPALVAPSSDHPAGAIAYTFNKPVDPASFPSNPATTGAALHFWYQNAAGNFCYSVKTTQITPTTIVADFPTTTGAACDDTATTPPNPANARQAGVDGGQLLPVNDSGGIANAPQGTNMPNAANGGATSINTLVSAVLDTSSGAVVVFNFDHVINVASVNAGQFHVRLADGSDIAGASVNPISLQSIAVTFTGMNFYDEYAVQAWVDKQAAATGSPIVTGCSVAGCLPAAAYWNSPNAVAIGGNSGAFSRGFTTGPDVYMVAFNKTSNVATLFFDQRVVKTPAFPYPICSGTPTTCPGVVLYDSTGNAVGNPSNISIPSFPNPGPVAITMDVPPSVMALNPVQIGLQGTLSSAGIGGFCEFGTTLQFPPTPNANGCSVPQIVQQVGSGVRIVSAKHVKYVKHTKHVKHVSKKHKARKSHKH